MTISAKAGTPSGNRRGPTIDPRRKTPRSFANTIAPMHQVSTSKSSSGDDSGCVVGATGVAGSAGTAVCAAVSATDSIDIDSIRFTVTPRAKLSLLLGYCRGILSGDGELAYEQRRPWQHPRSDHRHQAHRSGRPAAARAGRAAEGN